MFLTLALGLALSISRIASDFPPFLRFATGVSFMVHVVSELKWYRSSCAGQYRCLKQIWPRVLNGLSASLQLASVKVYLLGSDTVWCSTSLGVIGVGCQNLGKLL